ncbi:MAG: hypothetical protein R6X28_05595 [Bacteroidales bacterium]
MNNPLKYTDPTGYKRKKDPCNTDPPDWVKRLRIWWENFLIDLLNSRGSGNNTSGSYPSATTISPLAIGYSIYGLGAEAMTYPNNSSGGGGGSNQTKNNDNSTDIHLGYSGDIALVVGPIGGNYEMGELSKIGFFTTKGYSVGLEASFGFNILVLVPKSSFRVSNYFGETAEFDINLSGISLALTGDKSQYLINNQWFNSYFLFKFGIGLGAGGSYTPHSFTKKGNSFLEYFTTRQPNRIYWNPTWR